MRFNLSVVTRDAAQFNVLSSRSILQHENRLLLESFLEVSNGFIDRIRSEEKLAHKGNILIVFLVQPLENI